MIEKTLGDGITVDSPSEGYLRIVLIPEDTDLDPGLYEMAVQITWSPTEVYELDLEISGNKTNILRVLRDLID